MKFDDAIAEKLLTYLRDNQNTSAGRHGRSYAIQKRVRSFEQPADGTIVAHVQDMRRTPCQVRLVFADGRDLAAICTCRDEFDCRHAYAAALALMGEAYRRDLSAALNARSLLPIAWLKGRYSTPQPVFAPIDSFFQDGEYAESKPSPAEPEPPREPWWRSLLSATDKNEKTKLIQQGIASRIIGKLYSFEASNLVFLLNEFESPIKLFENFDRLLETEAAFRGWKLTPPDPDLAAYLQSEEGRAIARAHLAEDAARALSSWLAPQRAADAGCLASIRIVWCAVDCREGYSALCYRLLLTARSLHRSPRDAYAIQQLAREIHSKKKRLAPAEEALALWIASNPIEPPQFKNWQNNSRFDGCLLALIRPAEWLALWGKHDLIEWEDGTCARFDFEPARLALAEQDGQLIWMVIFPAEDSGESEASQPLSETAICLEGSAPASSNAAAACYVMRGSTLRRLETGQMPLRVLLAQKRYGAAPLPLLQGSAAGSELAQRLLFGLGRSGEGSLCRALTVQPAVEWRLSSTTKSISMTALARSQSGHVFLRGLDGEWTLASLPDGGAVEEAACADLEGIPEEYSSFPDNMDSNGKNPEAESPPMDSAGASAAPPLAIAFTPAAESIGPIDLWLAQIVPPRAQEVLDSQGRPSIVWNATPSALRNLVRLWPARPAGAAYLGNSSFRQLIMRRPGPRIELHIEPSGMDWLKVSFALAAEIESLSAIEIEQELQRSDAELLLLPGGRVYGRADLETYLAQCHALAEFGLDPGKGEQTIHAMQLGGSTGQELLKLADSVEPLRELAQKARTLASEFAGVPPAPIPEKTGSFLRPYQREGADFLAWAAGAFGGALLADDMGLGKTLQALAALLALRAQREKPGPSLVVCPASVAHNWNREAHRFAPDLRVLVLEKGKEREALLRRLDEYDLVIKNYALTRRDIERLRRYEWLMVCVDEAQAIKNAESAIARAVKSLKAECRFALTGTPIENRLSDLCSIAEFVAPGYLPSLESLERLGTESGPKALNRMLRSRLRPILMRRMKSEVAPELPERIEERLDCEMTHGQRRAYAAEMKAARALLHGLKDKGREAGQGRIRILAALTRLRQICCDPSLLGIQNAGSGKIEALNELLPRLMENGHKTLVFSQFVRMLERIQVHLDALGIPYRTLTGKTSNRLDLVDEFESDSNPSVFLISLKAGGTGLNLTSASHVILFDPWWNPAVEAQAIDRAHRIGQDKTVVAFRLAALDSIEERILELQEKKRSLVEGILEEEAFNRALTRDDFAFLLEG